ncbi:hypothetical protein BTHERMOSOX_840 [Bathymodiolus thermophilus thioautotrophic gill symbiont]|nr:hypothetical protein BTHERMOSOX_840 [Bathymodiolus thermophilus thioautotrophic gill symbiont]
MCDALIPEILLGGVFLVRKVFARRGSYFSKPYYLWVWEK